MSISSRRYSTDKYQTLDVKNLLAEREAEIQRLQDALKERDQEIRELRSQLDKFQCVLTLDKPEQGVKESKGSEKAPTSPHRSPRKTQTGKSAESVRFTSKDVVDDSDDVLQHYDKDTQSKELIKAAIKGNEFLHHLEDLQINEMTECAYPVVVDPGSVIIREGAFGSLVYVIEEGKLEVKKDGEYLCTLAAKTLFGELAILYDCERTASVRAVCPSRLWAINRQTFQAIMMKTGLVKQSQHMHFLKSIPMFEKMSEREIHRVTDLLEEEHYEDGEYIVRQGAEGDSFYIISKGKVRVTITLPTASTEGRPKEKTVREMTSGEYFGEQALKGEDVRTANVIAEGEEGVDCLSLDRDSFQTLIAGLREMERKSYRQDSSLHEKITEEFENLKLSDLEIVGTFGVGGYARVELVTVSGDRSRSYALKVLRKAHVVETKQQDHVLNEGKIMKECSCDFIVKLYKTFKDAKYLYMVLEACLGGEVWTILRDKGTFDDNTARFYTASVMEALEYLHFRGIIYRDVKPENVLIDNRGYAKLVDFGFSKEIGFGRNTWTFCGTPEYMAPEIVMNKGHDFAVDHWSIGIFMFELLTGIPPFTAPDPMKTYNLILKGVDALDFPRHMSKTAVVLIKKLCRETPSERLGCGRGGMKDIRKHRWFEGFNFEGLVERTLQPPIIPTVRSAVDKSNFDDYGAEERDEPPDDLTNWDVEF